MDADTVFLCLANITAEVANTDRRAKLKPVVTDLLKHLKLDPAAAEWLTGPAPRWRMPNSIAAKQRSHKISAILTGATKGIASTLFKFILIEYRTAGDYALTTTALAAAELGITEPSLKVRLSQGGGRFSLTRQHPEARGVDDVVTVSRVPLQDQPPDKAAALAQAEARRAAHVALVSGRTASGRRKFY